MTARIAVAVEAGSRRTFALAVDWPGWARSGRGEEQALAALEAYRSRYAPVAQAAGEGLPDGAALTVRERIAGDATTDFGAPGAILKSDAARLATEELARRTALLRACWQAFDAAAASAPAILRKGPRGGGRDRDAIGEHVLGAEQIYARKLGVRLEKPAVDDAAGIAAARDAIVAACLEPPAHITWPVPAFIRRTAWHVLDHAWEIEDRRG